MPSINQRRLHVAIQHALLCAGAVVFAAPALAASPAATPASPAATSADAQQESGRQDPQQADEGSDTDTLDDQATRLGTIVVTAQNRKQRLQTVPIAVHVVDAEDIQSHAATDLSEMDRFIPGLTIRGGQPTQPSYAIRGIGLSTGFGIGTDPTVGVYIDGVYSARSGSALLAFNDVKRIEVLKGPQGTLFGRNSAAGAISIITNEPVQELEAKGRFRIGNHGQRYGYALFNTPLGDNMALRVSGYDNQSNGWVRNQATGEHFGKNNDWAVRAAWALDTYSNHLVVTVDHERLDQYHRPQFGIVPLSSDTHERAPFPADPASFLDPVDAPLYNDAFRGGESRRYDDASAHFQHFFDWGTFTSISAWKQFDSYDGGDWDGTNHVVSHLDEINIESNESFSQEFRLSGQNDLINWVAGASWYQEQAKQHNRIELTTDTIDTLLLNLGIPTGTPDGTLYRFFDSVLHAYGLPYSVLGLLWREDLVNDLDYNSYAVYGDVIWHLSDTIDLTTGARFTRDEKTLTWRNTPRYAPRLDATVDALEAAGFFAAAGVNPVVFRRNLEFTESVGVPVTMDQSWSDFSPRVVLSDQFTSNIMGYVSVAKGYKAGGFNSLLVGSTYDPEKVWNYEAGVKTFFPAANLVFNASIYHYDYTDLQELTLDPNAGSSGIPHYITKSSDQVADGLDLEARWMPVDGLLVRASGAWIDSRYGNKTGLAGEDLTGQPTGVPLWTAAFGLQYTWHLPVGELAVDLSHSYRGARRCNDDSQTRGLCRISPNFDIGGAFHRTDLRLGWASPDEHFGLAVYARNLFDNRRVLLVDNTAGAVFGTPMARINPPRTYGLEFNIEL